MRCVRQQEMTGGVGVGAPLSSLLPPLVAAPDVVVSVDRLAVRGQRLVELLLDEVHVLQVVLLQHNGGQPVFRVPPPSQRSKGDMSRGSYLLPSVQLFVHIAPLVEVGEALGDGQEPEREKTRVLCWLTF